MSRPVSRPAKDVFADFDALDRSERAELEWWRHFAAKLDEDSELPDVGSPLLGYCWHVSRVDP